MKKGKIILLYYKKLIKGYVQNLIVSDLNVTVIHLSNTRCHHLTQHNSLLYLLIYIKIVINTIDKHTSKKLSITQFDILKKFPSTAIAPIPSFPDLLTKCTPSKIQLSTQGQNNKIKIENK